MEHWSIEDYKNFENSKSIKKYVAINDEISYNVLEKVYEFKEVVENAALKEEVHLITNYVYELASLFHIYYNTNKVICEDEVVTQERINVVKCVRQTIKNALDLIGVIPPEEM